MQKGIFDQMPKLVEMLVIGALPLSIFPRRNLRLHPLLSRLRNDGIAVISLVSKQMLGINPLNQSVSMCAIRIGT